MSNANGIPTTPLRTWFAAAGTGRRVLTTPVAVTLGSSCSMHSHDPGGGSGS